MLAKCNFLEDARIVFDELGIKDVVSATTLLSGYVDHGFHAEAVVFFEEFQKLGIDSNVVTYACVLKACSGCKAICKGMEIHVEIMKKGLDNEVCVGNILIDMYARNSLLETAHNVFDNLPAQDVVSWNTVIAGYAENGHGEKVCACIKEMYDEGIILSDVSFISGLKAYMSIGAVGKGHKIHADIVKRGLERENLLGNMLIDMYAKCGLLIEAQSVFDRLSIRDLVSWNSLMTGYAMLGESGVVFHILENMVQANVNLNSLTFINLLNACSHAGLTEKGQVYLDLVGDDYDLVPTLEHYTCIVDLLGRAGHIDKAISLIKKMPLHPGIAIWHVILGACQTWGNVELGSLAFQHALQLDIEDASAYVCIRNIYMLYSP